MNVKPYVISEGEFHNSWECMLHAFIFTDVLLICPLM